MDDTNIKEWTPIAEAPASAETNAGNTTGLGAGSVVNQWLPANQPGVLPNFAAPGNATNTSSASNASNSSNAAQGLLGKQAKTEEVRHGGPFSRTVWRWSIAAVVAIIGIVLLVELALSKLIDQYDSGTPERLVVICASLLSNDIVIVGVLIVILRRVGMSFQSLGIRKPADVKESIVLAFAAWLIFIMLAGVWALVSQSAAERAASNPFMRDKTVNTQDSPDAGSTAENEAVTSDTSSAESEFAAAKAEPTPTKQTNKRAEQSANPEKDDVADNRHVLIKVLSDEPPKALLITILITGCIGAPLLEELLVRGFLFGALSQRFGKLAGGAISSLLFGFAHITAYPLKMIPPLVVMGAALAWLAWQTGSIVPGMFIHAFVNSLGLGIAASLGGHIFTLMIGSWLAIGLILFPWIRKKSPVAQAGG